MHLTNRSVSQWVSPVECLSLSAITNWLQRLTLPLCTFAIMTTNHNHQHAVVAHYSLLTTRYSLLATHYSLLATHYSLLISHLLLVNRTPLVNHSPSTSNMVTKQKCTVYWEQSSFAILLTTLHQVAKLTYIAQPVRASASECERVQVSASECKRVYVIAAYVIESHGHTPTLHCTAMPVTLPNSKCTNIHHFCIRTQHNAMQHTHLQHRIHKFMPA